MPAARAEKANRFRHPGGNYSRKNKGAPAGLAVELVKLDFLFETPLYFLENLTIKLIESIPDV